MKSKLLLAAMAISAWAFSQDSTFQIKDYKYRTPGFRALSLNLNFSGNYHSVNDDNTHRERNNATHLGPIGAMYYQIVSTDRKFQENTIGFSGSYSSIGEKNSQYKSDRNGFSNDASWSILTKHFRKNQWFFEWGNTLSGNIAFDRSKTPTIDQTGKFLSGKNVLTLGLGKGRVELVQDAQMGMYILQDLADQNLLSRKPTAEEGNAFAQLITDINNRRVFDSRRRRIYELSRIDSFLKNSGLAMQTDIRHFTTVNDNWAFALNPYRRHGAHWFIRAKPGIGIGRTLYSSEKNPQPDYFRSVVTGISVGPEVGYENYQAVNLKWQKNFRAVASYTSDFSKARSKTVTPNGETKSEFDYSDDTYAVSVSYGVGYFPNTRTQIIATLGIGGQFVNDYGTGNNVVQRTWSVGPGLDLVANYFISYRTYLNASIWASYTHNQEQDGLTNPNDNTFESGFYLRLSHFIF